MQNAGTIMTYEIEEIYQTRRDNLIRVMKEKFNGRQVDLAKAINTSTSYLWRTLNATKSLGEEMARKYEKALGLPPSWLDAPNNSTFSAEITQAEDLIFIIPPFENSEFVGLATTDAKPVRIRTLGLSEIDPASLRMMKMNDPSMSASISVGDELIIDLSDTTPADGKIFAMQLGTTLRVRRLTQESQGKWMIRCDTLDKMRYPDVALLESEFSLIGRVAWTGGPR
jgi:hypothetical protein